MIRDMCILVSKEYGFILAEDSGIEIIHFYDVFVNVKYIFQACKLCKILCYMDSKNFYLEFIIQ